MNDTASSLILGTLGLALAACSAAALTLSRGSIATMRVPRVRRLAAMAVAIQAVHFTEESAAGFARRFPDTLGLAPWPSSLFIGFNVGWLAVWALAIAGLANYPRLAALPLWFLAIAEMVNGITHPLLALAVGGYFPGLWSSPFVGMLGLILFRALLWASRIDGVAEK